MPFTHVQARAARNLLGLDQIEVCRRCEFSQSSYSKYEACGKGLSSENQSILKSFFLGQGIEFIGMRGVAMREDAHQIFEGREGFREFMDDVYNTMALHGGDVCIFNSKPRLWIDWLGQDWYNMHAARMAGLGERVRVRITVQSGETDFILGTAQHKWFPELNWREKIVYVYGPKLAFLDFSNDHVKITVNNSLDFAESFKILFDIAWNNVAISPQNKEE